MEKEKALFEKKQISLHYTCYSLTGVNLLITIYETYFSCIVMQQRFMENGKESIFMCTHLRMVTIW